jgi:hypothetical protein
MLAMKDLSGEEQDWLRLVSRLLYSVQIKRDCLKIVLRVKNILK